MNMTQQQSVYQSSTYCEVNFSHIDIISATKLLGHL